MLSSAGALRMTSSTLSVLLPLPFDEPFAYLVEDGTAPPPGTLVRVPFGPRRITGVVWDTAPDPKVARDRLRPIEAVLDTPPLSTALRRTIDETAAETLAEAGSILRLVLSVPAALEPGPIRILWRLPAHPTIEALDARRMKVIETLARSEPLQASVLARKAGVSAAIVKKMGEDGLIEPIEQDTDAVVAEETFAGAPVPLTAEQKAAARALVDGLEAGGWWLLEGVPGSGKTEVYLEAVDACLRAGRPVLVLLPEIALGAQWLGRFERRFGVTPQLWHSGLTAAQRRRTWKAVARGEVRAVVGARSALFLPFPELGLIVMDEAHDTSFKQEDGVIYDARTVAAIRARHEHAALVLVGATPTLESLEAVAPGRHLLLEARYSPAPEPSIALVDLRREKPPAGVFLGEALRAALRATLDAGEQSMLFLNRRGYAPLTICRACGFRLHCPNCTAWLTSHHYRPRLQCHHCGYARPLPDHCPECGAVDFLASSGPGVERIAEELAGVLPGARLEVMTSDTVHSAAAAADLVGAMLDHRIDVLIGTQLIAKGHHFPDLTMVGVVDADIGLGGGDLRAAERTFQLLYQLSGRAGRESRPGSVLIQTRQPDHPVMQALARNDRAGFVAAELEERRMAGMPPFGRLAALILAGPDAETVRRQSRRIARAAPELEEVLILGPAPAPLTLLRGRYRERFLIKAEPQIDLPALLRSWLTPIRLPRQVRLQVDVDPQSFL